MILTQTPAILKNESHYLLVVTQYYSAIKRNEIRSFVEMWMDLEYVTQSEVSQKGKNKYHILVHRYGI